MLFDTHCHLDYYDQATQTTVINNAFSGGIKKLVTISTKVSEFSKLQTICKIRDNIYITIGNHPENVSDESPLDVNAIYNIARGQKNLVAVGETGLDYYHRDDNKTKQIDEFIKHIELAKMLNVAIVVHARDAWEDIFAIIEDSIKNGVSGSKFILHCFTGSKNEVERLNNLGCYISISGIVTFKNATTLREAVPLINKTRIIVETDSPFLAPMPHRGKQNQPLFVKHVADEVCKLCGNDMHEQIYNNSLKAFSIT